MAVKEELCEKMNRQMADAVSEFCLKCVKEECKVEEIQREVIACLVAHVRFFTESVRIAAAVELSHRGPESGDEIQKSRDEFDAFLSNAMKTLAKEIGIEL